MIQNIRIYSIHPPALRPSLSESPKTPLSLRLVGRHKRLPPKIFKMPGCEKKTAPPRPSLTAYLGRPTPKMCKESSLLQTPSTRTSNFYQL